MTITELIRAIKPFVLGWLANGVSFNERAAPGTPPTGTVILYAKADGKLYYKDDAGSEKEIQTS